MYSHAYDVAFEVKTAHTADNVTADEWLTALEARVAYLRANPVELAECMVCLPFDTFEYDTKKDGKS